MHMLWLMPFVLTYLCDLSIFYLSGYSILTLLCDIPLYITIYSFSYGWTFQFSSVQLLSRVSLRPHESQHARSPCPSLTPRVHSNSSPSSRWCHPAMSSSVIPFSSCPQPLPASESFPMSQLFPWGGQSTGVSASASFLPKKSQGWSPSEWTGWISLQSKNYLVNESNAWASWLWVLGLLISRQADPF